MSKRIVTKAISLIISGAMVVSVLSAKTINNVKAEENYGLSNPQIAYNYRNTVVFGNYWQEDTNNDGNADENDLKTPITWQILEKYTDGTALVISDKILDLRNYNDEKTITTWENAPVRKWLNNEFYNAAFSSEEKNDIVESDVVNDDNPKHGTDGGNNTKDKVFLLAVNDMNKTLYKFDESLYKSDQARKAEVTAYAEGKDLSGYAEKNRPWWLRSPGNEEHPFVYVSADGDAFRYDYMDLYQLGGVRPVLRINLSSSYVKMGERVKISVRGSEWDTVTFGKYNGNDIIWRVLNVDGNDAFLLSDRTLLIKEYNDEFGYVGWENCTLRKWLNEDFLSENFSDSEKNMIKDTDVITKGNNIKGVTNEEKTIDKVYLLSLDEIINPTYGFPDQYLVYSDARIATDLSGFDTEWWLRDIDYGDGYSASVYSDGYVNFSTPVNSTIGVRPVLHIDLSSSAWEKGEPIIRGDINEDYTEPDPTPVPTTETTTEKPSVSPTKPDTVKTPGRVKITKARNIKKRRLSVKWKKISGAKGYQVQYSTNKKFKKAKKTKTTKKTSFTIKKLKKKKTYYVRVRAYTFDASGKKVPGKWSKVKKVKIKK